MPIQHSTLWAELSDLDPDLVDDRIRAMEALEYASFVLWSLSGRTYSPITVTQEAYDTREALSRGSEVYPALLNGRFYNVNACSDCTCQGCGIFHRTRLRGYPVRYIVDVWINGCLVPRDGYVLLDNAVVGFKGRCACDSRCIVVKYAYGSGVPPGGRTAVVKLAEELIKGGRGEACKLPARITQLNRQGVSYTLLDPQDFLDRGRTGIYEIDLLLNILNPSRALKRARVFSPDIPRAETHSYAEPPISVKLDDADQVVLHGAPATWVINDPDFVMAAIDDKEHKRLHTVLNTGIELSGHWVVNDGTGTATMVVPPDVTSAIVDGTWYSVKDAFGAVLFAGKVRTL